MNPWYTCPSCICLYWISSVLRNYVIRVGLRVVRVSCVQLVLMWFGGSSSRSARTLNSLSDLTTVSKTTFRILQRSGLDPRFARIYQSTDDVAAEKRRISSCNLFTFLATTILRSILPSQHPSTTRICRMCRSTAVLQTRQPIVQQVSNSPIFSLQHHPFLRRIKTF
jgi:hypothetical protein